MDSNISPAKAIEHGREEEIECLIEAICSCNLKLSSLESLKPGVEVNQAFTELVGLCGRILSARKAARILDDPRILAIAPQLRQLCSEGEYQLEAHWAMEACCCDSQRHGEVRLLDFDDQDSFAGGPAVEVVENFPYYRNYLELINLELRTLESVSASKPIRKWAFIGSGPLPLSTLCILEALGQKPDRGASCCNIDSAPEAIQLSERLCGRLGFGTDDVTFQCISVGCPGEPNLDLHSFDVLCLAALVGKTAYEKHRILAHVVRSMRPGAMILLRSAHGLRSLLYPEMEIDEDLVALGLTPLLTVHPHNHIINSIIVATKESDEQGDLTV